MSPEKKTSTQKVCPTCGTRLSENATRCSVCGRAITTTATPKRESDSSVQGPHIPTVTLSLPLAIAMFIILIGIGAGVVYSFARSTPQIIIDFTATPSPTITATVTLTPTPTSTGTPVPPATPLPPKEYVVKKNDSCSTIAYLYNVSINSIILLNNLSADCTSLSLGQKLLIPQPTPTLTPQSTSTQNATQVSDKACDLFDYVVKEGDTLGSISANYRVPGESIKEYNGLSSDIVQLGMKLHIPLCKRMPTAGPTSTSTPPAPYGAANLLLPADGASYVSANDIITLQWSAVGTLRQNETYAVTIEDLTDGSIKKVDYVADTKYIVPTDLRPLAASPHIYRWWIIPVRQTSATKDGQPIYEAGGAPSAQRVFSWIGAMGPTPKP